VDISKTNEPLLAWAEPTAISKPASDFGVQIELHPSELVQPLLRERIVKDFAQDAAISIAIALIGGVLLFLATDSTFWHGFGLVLAVRVLFKLAITSSHALTAWLEVPAYHAGSLEIYPNQIRWVDSNQNEYVWPASTIRQIKLKVHKHRKGERAIMMVKFTRKISYQILVPPQISFDLIERSLHSTGIPVSRPKS
jgi:hypothetical protein